MGYLKKYFKLMRSVIANKKSGITILLLGERNED
ncbi:MAG: hypothetical protein BWY26_00277 [Elusimicrobia bacterium ADurb.Bin231]|nr:MAG: hypothetical protein BWY26_00277 [Elusimicrobia bacterium ADurb.Bin231]